MRRIDYVNFRGMGGGIRGGFFCEGDTKEIDFCVCEGGRLELAFAEGEVGDTAIWGDQSPPASILFNDSKFRINHCCRQLPLQNRDTYQ